MALIAILVIAGCGTANSSASPPSSEATAADVAPPPADQSIHGDPCEFGAVVFDVGPVALCQAAVDLATARLGPLHWPITSITFLLQICPPNARCRAPDETDGWVIFQF